MNKLQLKELVMRSNILTTKCTPLSKIIWVYTFCDLTAKQDIYFHVCVYMKGSKLCNISLLSSNKLIKLLTYINTEDSQKYLQHVMGKGI